MSPREEASARDAQRSTSDPGRRRARNRPKPSSGSRSAQPGQPTGEAKSAGDSQQKAALLSPKAGGGRGRSGNRGGGADRKDTSERQWHELTGSGRSQLSRSATIRARDADQPTSTELAEAEAGLVVQRRNWAPPTD